MNATDHSSDSMLGEAAAEWLCEREEGFKPDRAKAFVEWCDRDPRHAEAVARVELTFALLDEMPSVREPLMARLASPRSSSQETVPPARRRRILRFPRLAWAAGVAAALVLGAVTWRSIVVREPVGGHYVTNAAAQRSMVLPDGSLMDLNVGSDAVVQFTSAERRVLLNRGEALFEVAHDARRPFVVNAGSLTVRAVGTTFNVRLADEEVGVLVVEGKVKLERDSPRAPSASPVESPLLAAGERAELVRVASVDSTFRIEKLDDQSIRALLTWENSLTDFVDVPLRDVVARFNRRNETQLVVDDAELGDRKIGGLIDLNQVDAFARLLEQDGDIVAERRSGREIVLRRAR